MRIGTDGLSHLTYCTNIHPANGWDEVSANLQRYAPALKGRFAPDRPFGIGLRLSGQESRELLEDDRLKRLQAFLDQHGLYVFTLNGFPYGPFHKQPVKAAVHAPDWREEERVQYTLRLIDILATLLPAGVSGGISTSPLTYRSWVDVEDASAWERFTHNLVRIAVALVDTRRQRDRLIHLDIEPEADGLLQNSFEVAAFFTRRLLPDGAPLLAEMAGLSLEDARQALLDHIRVCLDTCHMAVAYEDPSTVVDRLGAVGIQIGKVQISSALEVLLPPGGEERAALTRALRPFADSIYLHQVGQLDHDGSFRQYPDLEDALGAIGDPRIARWRIHFHTPIFVERYASFGSTQEQIRRTLELLRRQPFCQHLEIETYTWDVLPAGLKQDLFDSIRREYEWVLDVFP